MTQSQKLERMQVIMKDPEFLPEYNIEYKAEALLFIDGIKDKVQNLSLRSLISAVKICAQGGDWKSLAKYVLTQGA
jgi:hypothetical protein